MDYEIKKKDSIYFLPAVEEWIFDSFNLNLLEGILYKLILQQGAFIWTSEYTGKILRVSGRTIIRAVESLVEKEIIKKYYAVKGSKTRWILVALYSREGKRSSLGIMANKKAGEEQIASDEHRQHLKKKRGKLVEEINNLDKLLGF